uniref:AKNA domain-containing protein n=1 Tax=Oryctolagus cuniculus TaxID=9986 RepID=A0A5F9CDY3_RABIT
MSMDEADFSEDMTYKQQEDLPYDGDLPRSKTCTDYNFTSKDAHWNVTNRILLIGDAPQEKATQETCRNRAAAMTLDKTTENAVNKKYDKEKHCAVTLRVIANEGDSSKTNISTVLHHHLSKERFLRGQGTDDKTLPKTLSSDSFEEAAIIENIISGYIQTPWPKEQSPAVTDQLNLKTDGESGKKPSCRITAEENIRDPKGPEVAGDSHHQENAAFLTQIKGPRDKPKNCPGQAPQKQETETATSGHGFQYGQGQVLYQLPDFSKVAPKVKMSKANSINRPFTLPKQPNFSPKLRYKPAIIHDILETMSRSNCAEKQHQEQKRKITEVSPQTQVNIRAVSSSPGPKMKPPVPIRQELLPGVESETTLFKLTSTSQKDHLLNSSYIFLKISQGKQMCQSLKEQTEQLKSKVQEFSKSIKQDSDGHLQDGRLEDRSGPSGRQERAETAVFSSRCAFCRRRLVEWKQKMEKKSHRRFNCGRFSAVIQEKALHPDSALRPSFCSESIAGLHSNKHEGGGSKSPRKPPKEFRYRYNSPGQNDISHSERSAFAQPRSASPCSRPKRICSQKVNSKSLPDEQEPTPGKKNVQSPTASSPAPASPSRPFQRCRISASKSLGDLNVAEQTESRVSTRGKLPGPCSQEVGC